MPEAVRLGFIGCGGHAFRWIYPALQFAPVELVAVCDRRRERAAEYAKRFGAERHYDDHREMLSQEDVEAVLIVTGYDAEGRPTYPPLATDCMRAGKHVWMEKPPASSSAEIEGLIEVSRETGRFGMVGFKKCFYPAIEKAKEITERPEFGRPMSILTRYPQYIPAGDERGSLAGTPLHGFLDHLVHPASILIYLMGPAESVTWRRAANGSGFALLRFGSGAVGCLHFAHGQSGTSPLERLEVIGEGANVVVENGVKLTYYRPGGRGTGGYAGADSFIGPDEAAPITWEPQFSLASMDAKTLNLEGFSREIAYFAECVRTNTPPQKASLEFARQVMGLYEAFLQPEGTEVALVRAAL
ncbi:MAG: Gfo/Idh/MocA family oxidoreductase [Armatimonadetes bacterium]|nr:Gfo/Idh/MocA family oxidoreductase [Armatimonadota bacterium]